MAKNERVRTIDLAGYAAPVSSRAVSTGGATPSITDADRVDGFHASATALANTLLALNGAAKLPASITGDADTVDGYDAAELAGIAEAETISGLWTFSRSTNAPFACVSGAGKVNYLDSDKLDGYEASAFPRKAENATITGTWAFPAAGFTIGADVSISRGAADRLDLASGDSFRLVSGQLQFGTDIVVARIAADRLAFYDDISSEDYASQLTGWRMTNAGDLDCRYIFADELHVKAFIADIEQALAGGQIISKSVAIISRDFTVPADGHTGTLYVEDLPGFANTAVFAANDYVRLRVIDRSGGGLVVADVWGQVTGYSDLSGGEQSWTFTTTDDGGVDGEIVYAGAIALDYGASGDGYWEVTTLDPDSPYCQIVTWTTNPWTGGNLTLRVRMGDLDGVTDADLSPTGWGLYSTNVFLSGVVHAAGGDVVLDADGVSVAISGAAWDDVAAYKFVDGATVTGGYYGSNYGGENAHKLEVAAVTGLSSSLVISADAPTGEESQIVISADDVDGAAQFIAVFKSDGTANISGDGYFTITGFDYLQVDNYIRTGGGVHVGGTSDPGNDNLIVDGDAWVGSGLVVGNTSTAIADDNALIIGPSPALTITTTNAGGSPTIQFSNSSSGADWYLYENVSSSDHLYLKYETYPLFLFSTTGVFWADAAVAIGSTSGLDTHLSWGLNINQGAYDDLLIAGQSSDVAHGMTDYVDTDTYFSVAKAEAASGGALIRGYKDADGAAGYALSLQGFLGEAADDTQDETGVGIIDMYAAIRDGTGVGTVNGNANILSIRTYQGATPSRTILLVDEDGNLFTDYTITGESWDEFDDLALLHGLRAAMMPPGHALRERFGQFLGGARDVLERDGVARFNESGSVWCSMNGLQMLTIDALRQFAARYAAAIEALSAEVVRLGGDPGRLATLNNRGGTP